MNCLFEMRAERRGDEDSQEICLAPCVGVGGVCRRSASALGGGVDAPAAIVLCDFLLDLILK